MRARGGCDNQRCHNKIPRGSGLDVASRFSELAEVRPVVCEGVPHVVGSDGKVRIERNFVYLSLSSCRKTLNSKKGYKTWTKKKVVKCSSVFDSYMRYEHYERFMHVSILVVFLDMVILHLYVHSSLCKALYFDGHGRGVSWLIRRHLMWCVLFFLQILSAYFVPRMLP